MFLVRSSTKRVAILVCLTSLALFTNGCLMMIGQLLTQLSGALGDNGTGLGIAGAILTGVGSMFGGGGGGGSFGGGSYGGGNFGGGFGGTGTMGGSSGGGSFGGGSSWGSP